MFGKHRTSKELDPPPLAATDEQAVELLRVWAAPGSPQQLTLRTTWKDPGTWGLLLVDIARHAALAYEAQGQSREAALGLIRDAFDAEWSAPTDEPIDLSPA